MQFEYILKNKGLKEVSRAICIEENENQCAKVFQRMIKNREKVRLKIFVWEMIVRVFAFIDDCSRFIMKEDERKRTLERKVKEQKWE